LPCPIVVQREIVTLGGHHLAALTNHMDPNNKKKTRNKRTREQENKRTREQEDRKYSGLDFSQSFLVSDGVGEVVEEKRETGMDHKLNSKPTKTEDPAGQRRDEFTNPLDLRLVSL